MALALQVRNQHILDMKTGYTIVVSVFQQENATSNTLTIPGGVITGEVMVKPGSTAPTTSPTFSGTTATIGAGGAGSYGHEMFLVTLHAGNPASLK